MNINNLEAKEKELMDQLDKIRKEKEALNKIIDIEIDNFSFSSGNVEIKLSEFRPDIVDLLRMTPSRYFSNNKNFINEKYLEALLNNLKDVKNVNVKIKDNLLTKVDEYRNTPDYSFELDFRKSTVIVKIGPKAYNKYVYNIDTWSYNQTSKQNQFSIAELYKLPLALESYFKNNTVKISDEVQKLMDDQLNKIKELERIHALEDAPEIESPFKDYNLTNDQRVGILFDKITNHRAIYAYDMGKGKTALAEALAEIGNERVLFVCKATLKTNIKRDIKKFTGKDAIVFSGVEPDNLSIKFLFEDKKQYNIINYDVIGRGKEEKDRNGNIIHEVMPWVEVINMSKFDRIIFDECHYMKNIDSKRSRAGRQLKSPKVSLLSGTPIVNRPQELYPALNIVAPEVFNNYSSFVSNFSDGKNGVKNVQALRDILKMYMIVRRNTGLDINRITYSTELSPLARGLYNKALEGLYINLRKGSQNDITSILTELLRLKQICADDTVDSTIDLAREACDQTEKKVLIFSQFKNVHGDLAKKLGKEAAVINGDVGDKTRYELVDKFQDKSSDLKYIITNIMEGLTLTEAHTVIFNDLWWTPKDHLQGEGRAFGRTNDYHAGNSYYMSPENTIVQTIEAILRDKLRTIKMVVDGEDIGMEVNKSMVNEVITQIKLGM